MLRTQYIEYLPSQYKTTNERNEPTIHTLGYTDIPICSLNIYRSQLTVLHMEDFAKRWGSQSLNQATLGSLFLFALRRSSPSEFSIGILGVHQIIRSV